MLFLTQINNEESAVALLVVSAFFAISLSMIGGVIRLNREVTYLPSEVKGNYI